METKNQLCRRLAATRQWLHQAEDSFGQKQELQGELKLFLAQAELQHAREQRRLPFWLQPRWVGQGLSLVLALLLVAAAGGGVLWARQTPPAPVAAPAAPAAAAAAPQAPAAPGAAAKAQTAPAPSAAALPAQPAAAAPRPSREEAGADAAPSRQEVISPQEMQQVVRAAGRALRGAGQ